MTSGNKPSQASEPAVEYVVFDQPSGNVRGTVTAFMPLRNGKSTKIAHAFLRTDKPAEVSVDLNEKFAVGDLATAVQVLGEFTDTVKRLDKQG